MRTNRYRAPLWIRFRRCLVQSGILILAGILLIAGLSVGLAILRGADLPTVTFLVELLGESSSAPKTFGPLFLQRMAALTVWLILLMLLGLCAVAAPLILAVPFSKGLGFSMVAGYYIAVGQSSWRYLLLHLFPDAFCSALLLIAAASQAFRMSVVIFRGCFLEPSAEYARRQLHIYCARFFLLFCCGVLGTAVSTLLSILGSRIGS